MKTFMTSKGVIEKGTEITDAELELMGAFKAGVQGKGSYLTSYEVRDSLAWLLENYAFTKRDGVRSLMEDDAELAEAPSAVAAEMGVTL